MSHSRQFIDQLAAGDSSAAKDTLENIISNKAFEALDIYKKEMSSSIFGGVSEAKEMEDDEDEKEDEDEDEKDDINEETNTNLSHLFSKHYGHVYDNEDSAASKVHDTVAKKYGKNVASDMVDHSQHALNVSFQRGKTASDAAKKGAQIRAKHNIKHEDFE